MNSKRLPLYTPRRSLFYPRCPIEAQYDDHHVPGFLGFGLIRSSSTPSATPRPSLEHYRSTKEQRSHVNYKGLHACHNTQGVSPSRHQHHHDTTGMATPYRGTSLQQPLQCPPHLLLQGITLGFLVHLGLHLSL
jgi:hypothetical protein